MISVFSVYVVLDQYSSVLYIGQTLNLAARIKAHHGKPWWAEVAKIQVTHFLDRGEAMEFERASIERLKPRHNTYGTGKMREPRGSGTR